jgi:hypothetical protein
MTAEYALWLSAMVAEAAVVALLLYRHVARSLPVFCLYCAWSLCTDAVNFYLHQRISDSAYLSIYLAETVIDSALQFSVLVELTWSVLKPIRASLPRLALPVLASIIILIGAAIWPLADVHAVLSQNGHLLMHLMQTVSILRIVIFLILASCSQLLSLSWRDRELQVATGLGIYSLAGLGVAMLHTHNASPEQNKYYNLFVAASYVITMIYWTISLLQREAERQEFTPQMQSLLLAMAGVARADREALAQRTVTTAQSRRDS